MPIEYGGASKEGTEQKRYSVLLSRQALDLHLKDSFYDAEVSRGGSWLSPHLTNTRI